MQKTHRTLNKPSAFSRKLRTFLWRWHRRVGLTCLVVFLSVSVTGVLLNHTSELALGKQKVSSEWLLTHYGFNLPTITSYPIRGHWLSDLGGDYLYLDSEQLAYCQGRLVGAVTLEQFSVVACERELLLLTPEGELVEHIGAVYGVPSPIDALGLCAEQLCLRASGALYLADVQQLQWRELDEGVLVPSESDELPEALEGSLREHALGSGLDMERVLLDLHSGRIFGVYGVWLVDLAALGLILLVLSGFWMWYQQARRRA